MQSNRLVALAADSRVKTIGRNVVKLREANVDDAEAIKNLVFGVLDEYGLKPDPGSTDRDLDDLDK